MKVQHLTVAVVVAHHQVALPVVALAAVPQAVAQAVQVLPKRVTRANPNNHASLILRVP